MSSATPRTNSPLTPPSNSIDAATDRCWDWTVTGFRALAFWSAIVLPVPSLMLLYGGVSSPEIGPLCGLLLANVLCLIAGHEYSP